MTERPLHQPPSAGQQKLTSGSDVHILDRLAVLYRYREISLAVFVLTSVAIMIQGYTNLKLFQAQGRLLIESERSAALPFQSSEQYYEDPQSYYNTQYKIIRGRDLTRRIVRKMHVETYPEFNGTADPPRTPLSMLSDLKQRIVGLVGRDSTAVESPKAAAAPPDEASLVDGFIGMVDVKQIRQPLVDVTLTSIDAQFAALAVNTLMDELMSIRISRSRSPRPDHAGVAGCRAGQAAAKGRRQRTRPRLVPQKQNAMSLDDRNNVVVSALSAAQRRLMKARDEKTQRRRSTNKGGRSRPAPRRM